MYGIATAIVILSGLWLIAVSLLMLYRPTIALTGLSKMASTNRINYTEITLRMISGAAFVLIANAMDYAWFFNFFGWFLVLSAAILFAVPRQWHHNYAQYWTQKLNPFYVRACAPFSIAAGVFIIKSIF